MVATDTEMSTQREFLRRRFQLTVPEQEFTPEEVARLRKYGHWFAALSEGRLAPTTTAQTRFVNCMQGRLRAESPDEKLWRRYRLEQLAQAIVRALEQKQDDTDPNSRPRLVRLARAGSRIAPRWVEEHPANPVRIPYGRSADRQAERAAVRGTPWERMSVYGMRHLCGSGPTWHLHLLALLQDEQIR